MSSIVYQRECVHRLLQYFIDMPRGPLTIQNWNSSTAGIGVDNLSSTPDDVKWTATWTADNTVAVVGLRTPEEVQTPSLANQREQINELIRSFTTDDVTRIVTRPATADTLGNGGSEGGSGRGTVGSPSAEGGKKTGGLFRLDKGPVETLRKDGYIYGEAQCTLKGEWNGSVKLLWLCGWNTGSSSEYSSEEEVEEVEEVDEIEEVEEVKGLFMG